MNPIKIIFLLCGIGALSIPIYCFPEDSPHTADYWSKLSDTGKPLQEQGRSYDSQPWACVSDARTGLTWEVKTRDGGLQDRHHAYSWRLSDDATRQMGGPKLSVLCDSAICNAMDYVAAINRHGLCHRHDWRLPTRWELATLIHYLAPASARAILPEWFPNTVPEFYWSSTVDTRDRQYVWGIGFRFGFDYSYPKASPGRIRLVSGPPFIGNDTCTITGAHSRFTGDSNGTVLDTRTGLRWRRCTLGQQWDGARCIGSGAVLTLSEAERQLMTLTSENGTWTLPDILELQSLIHAPCDTAAIDSIAFPGTAAAPYWSRTPFASDPERRWAVNFVYGENDTLLHSDTALVRPVLRPR